MAGIAGLAIGMAFAVANHGAAGQEDSSAVAEVGDQFDMGVAATAARANIPPIAALAAALAEMDADQAPASLELAPASNPQAGGPAGRLPPQPHLRPSQPPRTARLASVTPARTTSNRQSPAVDLPEQTEARYELNFGADSTAVDTASSPQTATNNSAGRDDSSRSDGNGGSGGRGR